MTRPLFPSAPRLTDRQQAALTYLGTTGATAKEVGLMLHQLNGCGYCKLAGEGGCAYAGAAGQEVLRALRRKGLVVRRQKTGVWQRVGDKSRKPAGSHPNELPEGF